MLLDKKQPIGLTIIKLIVSNLFWFLLFSFIYMSFNIFDWWLVKNPWGRFILILLEFSIIHNSSKIKK
jgi:hypothetical protein